MTWWGWMLLGLLLLAVFCGLRWLGGPDAQGQVAMRFGGTFAASPWWWLPAAVAGVGVLPMLVGYWLAPGRQARPRMPWSTLLAWLVLLGGAVYALRWPQALR